MSSDGSKTKRYIQPINEDVLQVDVNKNSQRGPVTPDEARRNEQLTHLYPQATELRGVYSRVQLPEETLADSVVTTREVIAWNKIIILGLVLTLPFASLDWMFTMFMRPVSDDAITILLTGLYYLAFAIAMLIVLRRYLVQELGKMHLVEGGQIFWSTVLFSLPITQFLRIILGLQPHSGPAPHNLNIVTYSACIVLVGTGILVLMTYLRYLSAGNEEQRLKNIVRLIAVPYCIGVILAIFEILRSFN